MHGTVKEYWEHDGTSVSEYLPWRAEDCGCTSRLQGYNSLERQMSRSNFDDLYSDVKTLLCCTLANRVRYAWIAWTCAAAMAGMSPPPFVPLPPPAPPPPAVTATTHAPLSQPTDPIELRCACAELQISALYLWMMGVMETCRADEGCGRGAQRCFASC